MQAVLKHVDTSSSNSSIICIKKWRKLEIFARLLLFDKNENNEEKKEQEKEKRNVNFAVQWTDNQRINYIGQEKKLKRKSRGLEVHTLQRIPRLERRKLTKWAS